MKRLGVLAVASLLSVGVMAGDNTISATTRFGAIVRNNDSATTRNSSAIEAEYLRLSFDGGLNASTKYHLVLDPVHNADANDTTTNISAFITEIGIVRSFGDDTSLIIGKQKVLMGAIENWYATPDVYTYSQYNSSLSGRTGAATLAHKMMGQEFKLQLSNGNEDKRSPGTKSQSKFGYAVMYKGNFMEGMIKPILGYAIDPTERKDANTYLSAGAQLNAAMFTVEAEYGLNTKVKASGTDDMTTSSIIALVRYNHDNFQPFVKFIADTNKTGSVKTTERTAFDLGLEMKEVKDDAVRYHIVYSSQTGKTSGVKNTEKPSQIYAGLKFTANFLK